MYKAEPKEIVMEDTSMYNMDFSTFLHLSADSQIRHTALSLRRSLFTANLIFVSHPHSSPPSFFSS
jgi:hypothetical protein